MKKTNNHIQQNLPRTSTLDTNNGQIFNEIINFLDSSTGFTYNVLDSAISIKQKEDSKVAIFLTGTIEKVLCRQDFDGSTFLQVNLQSGIKILITKNLIGFKPVALIGFDSQKIPKVVTTVDMKSVVSAIEESYEDDSQQTDVELDVLMKVYHSILLGAEAVGFNMATEKNWFQRNMLNKKAATA